MSKENPAQLDAMIKLDEFLPSVPPGAVRRVSPVWQKHVNEHGGDHKLHLPPIQLPCQSEQCGGERMFDPVRDEYYLGKSRENDLVVHYKCRNCNGSHKAIALRIMLDPDPPGAHVIKFGEFPRFGPPLPKRLRKLAENELLLLDKGYLAERTGLGIAAFAYYRRVVEAIKVRIIDDIIKASKILNASAEVIADLEKAKAETRFTQAVEEVKHGIPEALYINGHSPLLLLHDALSDHLHGKSDEECLELAGIVRVLLGEMAEKLAAVSADRKEVEGAVTALLKRKAAQQKQ